MHSRLPHRSQAAAAAEIENNPKCLTVECHLPCSRYHRTPVASQSWARIAVVERQLLCLTSLTALAVIKRRHAAASLAR
ncbi:hypothetical protein WN943_009569 [Citrus x changshan-huyou]